MADIPLGMPRTPNDPTPGWAPLALGFRPFFLLAGYGALALMLVWLSLWHTGFAAELYYGRITWHTHEMLFGYTTAVIAGFLLTAVRNWTGQDTATGVLLGLLAVLWLAGRLLPWLPGVPGIAIALVDLAFLPALALASLRPVWLGKNKVNRVFPLLLLAMAGANLLVHAQALGWTGATAARGTELMLDLVLILIVLVGGRVLPFFTEKAVPGSRPKRVAWLDAAGFVLLGALTLARLAEASATMTGGLAIAAGLAQAVRWLLWTHPGALRLPLLWVLHAGYAWLALGLVLQGLARLGWLPGSAATHALTAGAVGVFTLGMMARVALGHTGRPLQPGGAVHLAFWLINLAAAVRVLGPWLWPGWYVSWLLLAGLLWVVAFGVFAAVYTPILLRSRVDGRPG